MPFFSLLKYKSLKLQQIITIFIVPLKNKKYGKEKNCNSFIVAK